MTLGELYQSTVRQGLKHDPRRRITSNPPFADTAILHGDINNRIRGMMVGIDIDAGELLLADKLRDSCPIDVVIAHHPQGKAWAAFYEVMSLQVDMLVKTGIAQKVAAALVEERMREVERRVLAGNHNRCVDIARLLDIPFICAHTPADNHAYWYIDALLRKEKPDTIGDIVELLRQLPEYQDAEKQNSGPRIILGNPRRKAGKVFVEMTGGTEGPKDVFDKFYSLGVRTLVSMHLGEDHFKKVKDANLNVVIAGHISSDNLGLNLLLDGVEKEHKEQFKVINCSGFRRYRR